MKSDDSRIAKVLKLQSIAVVINFIISVCLGFSLGMSVGDSALSSTVVAFIASWVLSRILNVISLIVIQNHVYGEELEEMVDDATDYIKELDGEIKELGSEIKPQDSYVKLEIKILQKPEKSIGRFMDADFYEWLVIDDGVHGEAKVFFTGTIHMKNGLPLSTVPNGGVLFEPGILYMAEPV
jgi:hypothetical protein